MNRLSDRDILEILNSYNIKINGIYQKDKLPNKLLNGITIVNLQSSVEGFGTHWCARLYTIQKNATCITMLSALLAQKRLRTKLINPIIIIKETYKILTQVRVGSIVSHS